MSLFTVFRRWLSSHAAWKRATMYLVAALLLAMTAAVPAGTRAVHAAGLSNSASSASALTLLPYQHPPQTQLTVTGTGFVPSNTKNVAVYFGNQLMKDSTPTNGQIIAKFKVPIDPEGKYTVMAFQQSSGVQEQAVFTIIPGFQSLNPTKGSNVAPNDPLCIQLGGAPAPGQPLSVEVWGLPASTPFALVWRDKNASSSQTTVASGGTTASGTLSTSFNVPAEPAGHSELFVFTNQPLPDVTATFYSYNTSCFSIYENGKGTIQWGWDGVGWDANSTVTFTFNGSVIMQGSADTQGSFGIFSTQTQCPSPGTYPAEISGTADGQPQNWTISGGITVGSGC